jgi:hypothetical protein
LFYILFVLSFLSCSVFFSPIFTASNVKSYLSDAQLSTLFNSIFDLGTVSDPKIKKDTHIFDIPVDFFNVSLVIANKLEHPNLATHFQSVLSTYVTAPIATERFHKFIADRNEAFFALPVPTNDQPKNSR